jgi:Hda-like (regulatory inactivation of DnaA) protein
VSQIALPLDWPVADADEDFLISDANRAAFDHLKRWSTWPVMATLLTGPRKSGRSLLGRIFVRKTGGRLFDNGEEHDEEALFHAWNQAQETRRPLLLIAEEPPPVWQVALPDLRSRLAATPQVEINAPDDRLIGDLIVKLLGDRGIALPPELPAFLVPRIERSYVAVQQVVEALDRAALSHHRRMTVAMAKRALGESGMMKRARAQD